MKMNVNFAGVIHVVGQLENEMDKDPPEPQNPRVRTVNARDLLGSERILQIEHNGEIYTLRLTRNDRLILTK